MERVVRSVAKKLEGDADTTSLLMRESKWGYLHALDGMGVEAAWQFGMVTPHQSRSLLVNHPYTELSWPTRPVHGHDADATLPPLPP